MAYDSFVVFDLRMWGWDWRFAELFWSICLFGIEFWEWFNL